MSLYAPDARHQARQANPPLPTNLLSSFGWAYRYRLSLEATHCEIVFACSGNGSVLKLRLSHSLTPSLLRSLIPSLLPSHNPSITHSCTPALSHPRTHARQTHAPTHSRTQAISHSCMLSPTLSLSHPLTHPPTPALKVAPPQHFEVLCLQSRTGVMEILRPRAYILINSPSIISGPHSIAMPSHVFANHCTRIFDARGPAKGLGVSQCSQG